MIVCKCQEGFWPHITTHTTRDKLACQSAIATTPDFQRIKNIASPKQKMRKATVAKYTPGLSIPERNTHSLDYGTLSE